MQDRFEAPVVELDIFDGFDDDCGDFAGHVFGFEKSAPEAVLLFGANGVLLWRWAWSMCPLPGRVAVLAHGLFELLNKQAKSNRDDERGVAGGATALPDQRRGVVAIVVIAPAAERAGACLLRVLVFIFHRATSS